MRKLKFKPSVEEAGLVKLDLGCGKGMAKPEGFVGVDMVKHDGVDKVCDLRKPWPWKTKSVDEINAHYVIQYFTAKERVHFANEAFRVLKPGGKAVIVAPHWCASKAYGDPVAVYPPLAECWFQMLNKSFRDAQNFVDQSGLVCDFDFTLGYGMHPQILTRNVEYQQTALTFYKEAAQDIFATLIRR